MRMFYFTVWSAVIHDCCWTTKIFLKKALAKTNFTITNFTKSLILQDSFTQKTSRILWTLTHLTLSIICSQKPLWLYKFSSKHVSVWCQKKHLHCTISWRSKTAFLKHFENKCLYISVYLHKKSFVLTT